MCQSAPLNSHKYRAKQALYLDILVAAMPTKKELLDRPIQHLDLKQHNVVPLVDAMHHMAYSARDTARAAAIYDMMLRDTDCVFILFLAGSLISACLPKIFNVPIRYNMVQTF